MKIRDNLFLNLGTKRNNEFKIIKVIFGNFEIKKNTTYQFPL